MKAFLSTMTLAIAALTMQTLMADDSGQSRVSITKPIPCMSFEKVSDLQAEHGQPSSVEWARAESGQMSRFIWQMGSTGGADVSVTTYLPDGGHCELAGSTNRSLKWVTL